LIDIRKTTLLPALHDGGSTPYSITPIGFTIMTMDHGGYPSIGIVRFAHAGSAASALW
jgi:hypothetical protein